MTVHVSYCTAFLNNSQFVHSKRPGELLEPCRILLIAHVCMKILQNNNNLRLIYMNVFIHLQNVFSNCKIVVILNCFAMMVLR